jgi:hypothetical protein
MTRVRRVLALVVFALVFSVTSLFARSASAQAATPVPDPPAAKPSADDLAKAKKLFETGFKLFNEGAFDVALANFEQSYRLAGRPSALRNLAQCHRSLHHFVEAYEAYDALLARHASELPANDQALIKQAKDELANLSGTIGVTAPAGAKIEIDGKAIGAAPLAKPVRTTLGSHKLVVSQDGFVPFAQDVSIAPAQDVKVEAVLKPEPNTGHLAVRELHDHPVHVFVDGKDVGPAPYEGELSAGDHSLEAKGDKFTSEKRTITIVKKERQEITLDAIATLGMLRVNATPTTAQISVDGKPVGAGLYQGEFAEGPHTVEVTAPGYESVSRSIAVERGQTMNLDVPLGTVGGARGSTPADFRGVFVRLNLEGMIGNGMPDNAGTVATASSDPSFGFGGTARVGYSLHWLAFEAVGTFLAAFAQQDLQLESSATGTSNGTQHFKINQQGPSANGFIGAGARVTSRDDTFRFTAGLTPGLAIRSLRAHIENNGNNGPSNGGTCLGPSDPGCNSNGTNDDMGVGYTTFALRADGGILMGSTPGTKFFVGIQSWLDFPPGKLAVGPDTRSPIPNNAFAAPGRGIYVVSGGPQVFVGPEIGVQFGR